VRNPRQQPTNVLEELDEAAELAHQAKALAALIDEWMNVSEEEAAEQRETGEFLRKALDEGRAGYRTLFS
jgi:hypothetical protein